MLSMWPRWGMMMCGSLLFLLVLAAIVAVVIFAARSWPRSGGTAEDQPAPPSSDRALDVLRERYARGEITKEQFDAIRRDLTT